MPFLRHLYLKFCRSVRLNVQMNSQHKVCHIGLNNNCLITTVNTICKSTPPKKKKSQGKEKKEALQAGRQKNPSLKFKLHLCSD